MSQRTWQYDRTTKCNTKVLRKISEEPFKLYVIIRKKGFDGSQPITIISFPIDFHIVCNNTSVLQRDEYGYFPTYLQHFQKLAATYD